MHYIIILLMKDIKGKNMKKIIAISIIIILLVISLSGCNSWVWDPFKWKGIGRWSIGIYAGDSPLNFSSPRNIKNPVLTADDVTDSNAWIVADPFMIQENSIWYMFFEVWNYIDHQADVAVATSYNGFNWTYKQIVINEPNTSLSYPQVFKWDNEFYMIPASYGEEGVRLYKAINFPYNWSFEGNLIEGSFCDPTIFRYNNMWWMFVCSTPKKMDTLSIYYSDNLKGPWAEHPENPIIKGDPNIARPGGRVIVLDNQIIRYTQDDYPTYGNQIRAFIITQLTPSVYEEEEYETPILKGSGTGWNADGMHTIDPHQIEENQWIACVDGYDKNYYITHDKSKLIDLMISPYSDSLIYI